MVIPFDAVERKRWKAAHVGTDDELEALEREQEAIQYLHWARTVAVAEVGARLGFPLAKIDQLLREVSAGW